jgi:hypothetical protein
VVKVDENGNGAADPAEIRPALGRLAAANLNALERELLTAATSAVTTRWTTVTCSGCGTKSRVELPMPDVRSRLQAIELLLSQSLGRPATAEEPPTPRMPTSVEAVKRLSWDELSQLMAVSLVSELADMERSGSAEAVLQERLARLSDGELRALRRAVALQRPE